MLLFFKNQVLFFVFLQDEVSGGAGDVLQGSKALSHELGDFLQRAAGDDYGEVEGARHEIDALHFLILIDALGNTVKAFSPLGRNLNLDQGGNGLPIGAVPVDDCLVTEDNLFIFIFFNGRLHFINRHGGHRR